MQNAVAGTFFVDSGAISLAGHDVTNWPEHRRARFIGRVFQNPFSGTSPNMSIAENLALAAGRGQKRGLGWALNSSLMSDLCERVRMLNMKLEDRLDNIIGSLSGGQRQALTLLMATWLKPKLLLLDEHTAALDPKSASQVIRLSEEIIVREKLTTLMVTHSMHQAANRRQAYHDVPRSNHSRLSRRREKETPRGRLCWRGSKRCDARNSLTQQQPKCSAGHTSEPNIRRNHRPRRERSVERLRGLCF